MKMDSTATTPFPTLQSTAKAALASPSSKHYIPRRYSSDSAQKMPPPPPRFHQPVAVKEILDRAKHTAALIWVFRHSKECFDDSCEITGCFAAKKTLANCIGDDNCPKRQAVRHKIDNLLNHEENCGRMGNGQKYARSCLVCTLLGRAKANQFKRGREEMKCHASSIEEEGEEETKGSPNIIDTKHHGGGDGGASVSPLSEINTFPKKKSRCRLDEIQEEEGEVLIYQNSSECRIKSASEDSSFHIY